MPLPAERAGRPEAPDGNLQSEPGGILDEHSRQLPPSARETDKSQCRGGCLATQSHTGKKGSYHHVIESVHSLSQTLGSLSHLLLPQIIKSKASTRATK